MRHAPLTSIAALLTLLLCASALAVKPSHWTHTSETDFKAGTFSNTVATNLGDVKLSREVKLLLGQDPRVSAIHALAQTSDGTIYAGTGPQGVLLAIKDDRITTAAELGDNVSIFSLRIDSNDRLLIGTGGERGEILRQGADGEKPTSIFSADGVQYVWSIVEAIDGTLYAATGPNGQLFAIDPDGSHKVLFDSEENNLLSMIGDGKDSLYVGTDPNGLVYRVNRKSGEMFVVYDAAETEVSALAIDRSGNVYAATAQPGDEIAAMAAGPETMQIRGGRPESESTAVPIPSEPPATPRPPEVPEPAPGEPLPIPKSDEPKQMMMILAQDAPEDAPGTQPGDAPQTTTIEDAAQLQQQAMGAQVATPAASGNAIYRIDPSGFVTEIFRQPVMIFALLERNGTLVAATGSEGEIYQVNPGAEETSVLAKVDPRQVMSMLRAKDGRIYLGMANSGEIGVMTGGFASRGTYTSPVLDATQISRFGKMRLLGTLPAGTALSVATRSGNVQEAAGAGWSAWSQEISATEYLQIPSPAARFLQYRLTFQTDAGRETPIVLSVDVAYQLPNLAPQVQSITVTTPTEPGEAHSISWEATDANDDELSYGLHFRLGTRGPWVLIKDKLTETSYQWQSRNVADGTYQLKVEASDESANALGTGRVGSRVSDSVVVDHTAPVIGDMKSSVNGGGDVTIELTAVDRTTTVAAVAYSVDSATDWQAVVPSDNIADSPEETYRFTIPALAAGAHQITVRATDGHGNAAFETISVIIEKGS